MALELCTSTKFALLVMLSMDLLESDMVVITLFKSYVHYITPTMRW
jgi:hypothetical protein